MSRERQKRTQERIDAQLLVVAALAPGSEEHRLATNVLLLLQDSLHVHRQIDELIAAARRLGKAE